VCSLLHSDIFPVLVPPVLSPPPPYPWYFQGNLPPSFTLSTSKILLVQDGLVATTVATQVSSTPPGVILASETDQVMSFNVVIVSEQQQQKMWKVEFRPLQAPHISREGKLTLALASNVAPILEDEAGFFQLQVTLHDDGGVDQGGMDTSASAMIDFVVIGTPQKARFVQGIVDKPLAISVTWLLSEEAIAAHEMGQHTAPGIVGIFVIELRSWSQGVLKTLHKATVLSPQSSVIFENLNAAQEYFPIVSACNALVCSNTQAGAAAKPLDVPSQPLNVRIVRRSKTEILLTWDEPSNIGDYTALTPTTNNIGVRLEISNGKGQPMLTIGSLDWMAQKLLRAEGYPVLFAALEANVQLFLSMYFANQVGNSLTSTVDCTLRLLQCEIKCGDAHRAAAEACDDGNTVDGDGCSKSCSIEPEFFCYDEIELDYVCQPALNGKSQCWRPAFISVRAFKIVLCHTFE